MTDLPPPLHAAGSERFEPSNPGAVGTAIGGKRDGRDRHRGDRETAT